MTQTRAVRAPGIAPGAVIELLKPVTWFPPAWAFACGAVAASTPGEGFGWGRTVAGIVLAGPLVCGASQAINDWCDRHVDAINQPERPIPSGRLPGRSGWWVAVAACGVSLAFAALLGLTVLAAAALALAAGWAYSAPPFRLKADGWWGPLVTALSYEGLAWITGALVIGGEGALARPLLVPCALLYSLGAFGIMVLNDFKAVAGDRATGIASLPVTLGVGRAVRVAAAAMLLAQGAVVALLVRAGADWRAGLVLALAAVQAALMPTLFRDPEGRARWFNAAGVTLYVAGMMIAAFAIRAGE